MRQDFTNVTEDMRSELFPIILKAHDPAWLEAYLAERGFLQYVFSGKIKRISHIGSASVPGLISKPTVDVLLEIARDVDLAPFTEKMLDAGYVVNTPPQDIVMYLRGYTPRGFEGQCAHIHVRHAGDWDELYFRDYLIAHPETARDYGELKLRLKEEYTHDRDAYTDAKGNFIERYTKRARKEFPGRYVPEEQDV